MFRVIDCIAVEHDIWLVAIAAMICLLASHTAISLLLRARQQTERRLVWLAAAAVAMGAGVWSTHFIAMLAYKTPWPLDFAVPTTIVSALVAIGVSGVGLWLALADRPLLGGAVAGSGISGMHFIGMSALKGAFHLTWDPGYVLAAIVAGVGLSMLTFKLLPNAVTGGRRPASVIVYALAICSMHFTAMSAATLSFDPTILPDETISSHRQTLAILVAAVAILLLCAGLMSAVLDGYLADRNAREAEQLRRHVAELEATQEELRAQSDLLRSALEAAAASSQAKSQFLAIMSHELRTPLNAILGFAELLRLELHGPLGHPTYISYADDIHQSGNHLLNLINDVLDFSKIEAGKAELDEEMVDACLLLSDCMRLVSPQAIAAALTLDSELPDRNVTLYADHRRLKQIVLNLLSNAIKFSAPGAHIRTALWTDADGVVIAISDTGVGMTAEQIPVALEAFGQVDSRLSRNYEGTGLGLPLSARLAELHGGTLKIESAPGKGTTVTVRLPQERLRSETEFPSAAAAS